MIAQFRSLRGRLFKRIARQTAIGMFLCGVVSNFLAGNALAQNRGYWQLVDRPFATTQFKNVAAIAAHNCYVDSESSPDENLRRTLEKIHAAQSDGADLIELDVCAAGGKVLVAHDDDGNRNRANLIDVLKDSELMAGNQVLFIEIKEQRPTASFVRSVLQCVDESGVARKGRPIVFRAFDNRRKNLTLLQSALKHSAFERIREYVQFHEFIRSTGTSSIADVQKGILRAKESGFDGVEFRFDMPNLFAAIEYAKSHGLGVGVFTIPARFGEVFVAALREDVDCLVVDYPVAKSLTVVKAQNGLIHLNTAKLDRSIKAVAYSSSSPSQLQFAIQSFQTPILRTSFEGSSFYGTTMVFSPTRSVTLYDADNSQREGYLLSACVGFDELNLADGQTSSVIAKSDSGGFALELHNPNGAVPTVLRFGVHVGETYHYASISAEKLNDKDSYFVVGAYDGDGSVRLWIDGRDEGIITTAVVGGVRQNESPVVIGADPQGQTDRRFYFRGVVQQVQLQSWGGH